MTCLGTSVWESDCPQNVCKAPKGLPLTTDSEYIFITFLPCAQYIISELMLRPVAPCSVNLNGGSRDTSDNNSDGKRAN